MRARQAYAVADKAVSDVEQVSEVYSTLLPPLFRHTDKFGRAGGERRQVGTVGPDDVAFRGAPTVALAVWRTS